MSFQAILVIEEDQLRVLDCEFEFNREVDLNGRPMGRIQGGLIHIRLESTGSSDFFAWISQYNTYKNGEITFFKRDMMSSYKTLLFENAVCCRYKEVFSASGDVPMGMEITISAQTITINDTMLERLWYTE